MVNFNVKIRKVYYIFLCSLAFVSCSRKLKNNIDVIDTKWKKEAMFSLSESYMRYKEHHDLERKRHSEIDLFMKFDDINRYPFGIGFDKLKMLIVSRKIKFDSIVCLTTQTSRSFDPEYLYPNYFYIFKKDKISQVFIFEPESLDISESEDSITNLESMFKTVYRKIDGDDLSLLIFTKINFDWSFEIEKIVINSY